jgi:uncharacterized protein YacL
VCPGGGLILKLVIAVLVAREEMLFAPAVQKTVAMTIACVLCNLCCVASILNFPRFVEFFNHQRIVARAATKKKQSRM